MDVVTIERRDERGVEQLHGLVRDAVGAVLGVFDGLDARCPVRDRVVVTKQIGQRDRAFDDQFRVVVEEDEEMPSRGIRRAMKFIRFWFRRDLRRGV